MCVCVVECGSDYDSPQWLDTNTSSETLNGVFSTSDHSMNSSSAAINDNFLNSQRQFCRDGYDILSETTRLAQPSVEAPSSEF